MPHRFRSGSLGSMSAEDERRRVRQRQLDVGREVGDAGVAQGDALAVLLLDERQGQRVGPADGVDVDLGARVLAVSMAATAGVGVGRVVARVADGVAAAGLRRERQAAEARSPARWRSGRRRRWPRTARHRCRRRPAGRWSALTGERAARRLHERERELGGGVAVVGDVEGGEVGLDAARCGRASCRRPPGPRRRRWCPRRWRCRRRCRRRSRPAAAGAGR